MRLDASDPHRFSDLSQIHLTDRPSIFCDLPPRHICRIISYLLFDEHTARYKTFSKYMHTYTYVSTLHQQGQITAQRRRQEQFEGRTREA